MCRKYNIPIIEKQRTLSHVIDTFKTIGIANIQLTIGDRTYAVEADVMPMKSKKFILGSREFKRFGFSLQGEGLLPSLDLDTTIYQQSVVLTNLNRKKCSRY